jgi:N-acetyl-S-(2-succino)cysteine monooxygenase
MKLGAFLIATGHHVTSWRHPDAQADDGINARQNLANAQTAERGKFDLIFFADNLSTRVGNDEAISRSAQYVANFEPITLLSAISAVTKHIGLVSTASTSYNAPFSIARAFASLDWLSGGRAGWNIVTSAMATEAYNFGREEHYGHEERYERAREFTDVVLGLWDSWDDDAFVRDKESGLFFDPAKRHALNHKGKYFSVRGPLNVPRTPQGHPVLVQAGASDTGRAFAAAYAEVIFTAHLTEGEARDFYSDIKERVVAAGRERNSVVVLPGLSYIVGRTESEAREKYEYLQSLIHPVVAREILSFTLGGADLTPYDPDGPLPDLPQSKASISSFQTTMKLARDENLTIRQLGLRMATSRQRFHITGTPVQIADVMEHWYKNGAADGFNMLPPYLPGALDDFVDLVVPELQRRGLFRREYAGTTLRDNLELSYPRSRYALS